MSKSKRPARVNPVLSRYAKIKGLPRAEIAEIVTRLFVLFGPDEKKVSDWLNMQTDELEGKSPIESLKEDNIKQVFDLLREKEKKGDLFQKILENSKEKMPGIIETAKALVKATVPVKPLKSKRKSAIKRFFEKKDDGQ